MLVYYQSFTLSSPIPMWLVLRLTTQLATKMVSSSSESSALIEPTSEQSSKENEPLSTVNIRVYKRRWYILAVFTSLNAVGNIIWNTWPPIQETCQLVFYWTDLNVLIIGALQALGSIISVFPSAWLLDTKGLRVAVLVSVSLQCVAMICQLIPAEHFIRTVLITFGEFLISLAVPAVQNIGVLVLSATWFPPNERMTATAIATLVSYLGSSFSYVAGPNIVPDVDDGNFTYKKGHKIDIDLLRNHTSPTRLAFLESRINDYLYVESAMLGFLFLCVIVYFPAKPPTPPSLSSASSRLEFCPGFRTLLKNKHFLLLLAVFSFSCGVNWAWASVQDVILSGVGIDQKTAGWLGFLANIASLLGIVASYYADRLKQRAKPILINLFLLTTVAQLALSLACEQVIPLTTVSLYIAGISQVIFFSAGVPLLMEIAVECTYPVAEGITSGFMIFSAYFINMLFFIGFMFPHASPRWMNWVLVVSTTVCIPLLAFYPQTYKRLDVDLKGK